MTDPVTVALIGGVALTLSGVLVELLRGRALGTTLRKVAEDVAVIRAEQHQHHTRVAVVERLVEDHLKLPHVMNGRR